MTWFKDLDVPETFGFLRGQTTPFSIRSSTGEMLYAWHILPVELYRQHELALVAEPSGFASDITTRFAFKLLRNDPDAQLIIHMHGAAGTVRSGTPSERGLCLDAVTVVEWATKVASIPPSRTLIFSQSLGTAISLAVSEHFALQCPPIVFAGSVLVAPFADVAMLAATYRVACSIPILSPLTRFPLLSNYLSTFIQDKWLSKDRIAEYIRANEANGEKYQLTLIYAEEDYDISSHHAKVVFWHAVNATVPRGISYDELEETKYKSKTDLGAARVDHGVADGKRRYQRGDTKNRPK
ncbi:MAG: hypothetical protein Q9187_007633 [Circinaria calcarea]